VIYDLITSTGCLPISALDVWNVNLGTIDAADREAIQQETIMLWTTKVATQYPQAHYSCANRDIPCSQASCSSTWHSQHSTL